MQTERRETWEEKLDQANTLDEFRELKEQVEELPESDPDRADLGEQLYMVAGARGVYLDEVEEPQE